MKIIIWRCYVCYAYNTALIKTWQQNSFLFFWQLSIIQDNKNHRHLDYSSCAFKNSKHAKTLKLFPINWSIYNIEEFSNDISLFRQQ